MDKRERARTVILAALNEPCNRAHETRSRNAARPRARRLRLAACFFNHDVRRRKTTRESVGRGSFAARQLVKRVPVHSRFSLQTNAIDFLDTHANLSNLNILAISIQTNERFYSMKFL